MKQRTIRNVTSFSGVGLHSGRWSEVTICEAPPNTGIRFYQVVDGLSVEIPLSEASITDTQLCSAIEYNGAKIKTVEHFLAALALLGIDNLFVHIDGDEIPILDGSANPFIYLLNEAGVMEQNAPKKVIRITKPIEVRLEDKWLRMEPHDCFSVDYTISFDHSKIQDTPQNAVIEFADIAGVRDIARSRTFGFLKEIEYLQSIGLVKGGSLDNAIVLDEYGIMNDNGLRCEAEFVNHKILDAIGDFYVSGIQIIGKITAYKSGHALNNMAFNKLLSTKDAWELVELVTPQTQISDLNLLINNESILAC
ncbi:UDP-3-O-acyl-N-acetylglucosamine deacetylase [Vibrio splendidus]|nr:UDP-3-O-acyl-N-acetylglucosamine deacetylase [Vibrio splendidus]MCC4883122.1 UDP-3-O-acyl-N-acetylglucosamine deacetylase [Vibrio splendidus]